MMKITKTNFYMKVNEGSSWKVYICKNRETASAIRTLMMTAGINAKGNYWHVSTCEAEDCVVPDFFKGLGLYRTMVEHNNGDWNSKPTYELFIVED